MTIIITLSESVCIVSRHNATIKWLLQLFPDAEVIEQVVHPNELAVHDVIIGNLPLKLIAGLPKETRYLAVEFERQPPRGVELTPAELEAYGIRLQEYKVVAVK